MASPQITPDASLQNAQCTTLAPFGIADIPDLTSTFALSIMNAILVFMCSWQFTAWKYPRPSSSTNANAETPATSPRADANAPNQASGNSNSNSHHTTKASRLSTTKTSTSDIDAPPAYSSNASIGSGSDPFLSPPPFAAAPPPAPETRAFVNATLFLAFHFFCILSGGFLISRLIYCPPHAPTESFPNALLWTVYGGHVLLLAVRLAHWLEVFGALYPEESRPRWAKADTVWVILRFPVAPLTEGYSWLMGRVERHRVKLGEERDGDEGVALADMSGGRRGGRKGRYQRVPGEEVEGGQGSG